MDSDNSKGNARPAEIPLERRLTVGTLFYEYPPRKDDPPHTPKRAVRVPWLQMKGQWLAAAGFDIRSRVRVQVSRGCLVLTVEEE